MWLQKLPVESRVECLDFVSFISERETEAIRASAMVENEVIEAKPHQKIVKAKTKKRGLTIIKEQSIPKIKLSNKAKA